MVEKKCWMLSLTISCHCPKRSRLISGLGFSVIKFCPLNNEHGLYSLPRLRGRAGVGVNFLPYSNPSPPPPPPPAVDCGKPSTQPPQLHGSHPGSAHDTRV